MIMGVQSKNCAHLGLIWMFGILFCALLVHAKTHVSADPQEDEDLVFDNLELANFRSLRIPRESSDIYSQLTSSQLDEDEHEHWLARTVNRIKRSIGNIFSSEEKQPKSQLHQKTYDSLHQSDRRSKGRHPNLQRNHRQADYDEDLDDDEQYDEMELNGYENEPVVVDDLGQQFDTYDTLNPENEGQVEDDYEDIDSNDDGFAPFNISSNDEQPDVEPDGLDNEDDEDYNDENFASGKSSGDGEITEPEDQFPKYYRMALTVGEFYKSEFEDRDTEEFRDLADKIQSGVDTLFRNKRGAYASTVISIAKIPSDNFKVLTTVDLTCTGTCDNEEIKSIIFDEIQSKNRLGSVTVTPDNFDFVPFDGTPSCKLDELQCNSNQCVDSSARCNGIRDCNDNSDEVGCPIATTSFTTASNYNIDSNVIDEETTTTTTTTTTSTTTTTMMPTTTTMTTTPTTTTTTTPFPEFGSGDGDEISRADDLADCDNGRQTYYGDQKCDGIRQCDDGSDEKDCQYCMQGELMCDVRRCIDLNDRCNGRVDCDDGTDEQDCERCSGNAFFCDSKCILNSSVCDGVSDCKDGTDEASARCSVDVSQCLPTEFHCGGGQCIPSYLRCSGSSECANGADERDCGDQPFGDEYFYCESGESIPIKKRCDRQYDCSDQSDEKRCPCLDTDFHCRNGFCIPHTQRCDGIRQCQDASDEYDCENLPQCQRYEWQCANGECIDQIERCDHSTQCSDGSDEADCTFCGIDTFRCHNGSCVPSAKRCNGIGDCPNSEDEENCGYCMPEQFMCKNGECVHESERCNGQPDCSDRTDEFDCGGQQDCPEGGFRCSAGFCIMGYKRCNGIKDCEDNSDEANCPTLPPDTETGCKTDEFTCGDGTCIGHQYVCDLTPDCMDRSDELNCHDFEQTTILPPIQDCSPDQIQCRDGSCVYGLRCDRQYDCVDGTDEEGCVYCTDTEFKCRNGHCIDARLRCDHLHDCRDGSDEENCGCREGQFDCGDGTCIEGIKECDGRRDCPQANDELNCSNRTTQCGEDQFDCNWNNVCVQNNYRCDGTDDCGNNADEENCGCQPYEHRCSNGECISQTDLCNRVDDCSDGSDEANCTRSGCGPDEFKCERDNQCVPISQLCDRQRQCSDGSDEQGCQACLDPDWFECADGSGCVETTLKCDNVYDCKDFSDEQNCFACNNFEFQCSNGDCIDYRMRCNGSPDCSDYSDEYNCPTTTEAPVTLPPVTPPPRSCPFGYVSCRSDNQCILRNQLCDGRVNCQDMSDEDNCQAGAERLDLRTYPNQQDIKENKYRLDQEVVFQCRDEGPIRASVEWRRANGQPLPPGSRDFNGRLEMPNIKVEHGGTYVCVAKGFPPGTPGAEVQVQLFVDKAGQGVKGSSILKYGLWAPLDTQYHGTEIVLPPPTIVRCHINESTCANGDCIPRHKVCDRQFDCSDGSDELRCRECEPNEFKCENKKCISAVWKCDGQDDCTDGSDEKFCQSAAPGQQCSSQHFTCRNDQCVPRTFHCDGYADCIDKSDEIGCTPPVIAQGPPSMISLNAGQTFTITCRAVGVPTPQIMWRLNWHQVPPKCRMTSENGFGTLVCENIQVEDQGAYSCEALSTIKAVFASQDTTLIVKQESPCRSGYFNVEARAESECIKCFCFGHTSSCRSADLYIFQFQPPFDSLKLLGARIDRRTGVVDIRDEPIYKGVEPQLQHVGANGVKASLPYYTELNQPDVVPYFALPENYHGNQLKSYGGYLKYTVHHENVGQPIEGPDVILTGNNYVLLHESRTPPQALRPTSQRVRFFEGDWVIKSNSQRPRPASREEIMMALEDVTHILIKLEYNEGILNTTISDIEMDSAAIPDSGLGIANYVEECSCPVGYSGMSCENCAEGYVRQNSGQWLGQCYKEPPSCPPGNYFDGRECQVCPCPYTSPSNQFARTCHLNTDGNVVCDCQHGYDGLRCEHCAPGFIGNPLQPGDSCRPSSPCDPQGTIGQDVDGRCLCKEYTTGPYCNQCKPNSFYLSTRNQFGCISCFCMGVTQQCSSSSWYRDTISSVFTSSTNDFRLTELTKENTFTEGIRLNQDNREIAYNSFSQPEVYYWTLPNKYLGDKVTSYGGYLRYTIRNTPVPGGASSRNNAPDVELVSANRINLQYFSTNATQSTNSAQTFEVPLLEQYWQRNDGVKTDREHLLMTLADLQAIYIKATFFTNTQEAALISVSLDTAIDQNTGRERAYEVEQCHCPEGYMGLSCEDCAFGYTRSDDGIYLELCEPCECNGYSNECDPETGVCRNCRSNTAGDQCDQCLPGFTGDPTRGEPCVPHGLPPPCNCDPRGSTYHGCQNGICQCKANVEGPNCDRCRNGTYGLSADNIEGCEFCFCSGVSSECSESQLNIEQIPVQVTEQHGFILTDQYFKETIKTGFMTNLAHNEIGYTFPPSRRERMYWSLPSIFTRNQIKSYGGSLEYMQRYSDLPHAQYYLDKDIIITGNNVVIYWSNPAELKPEIVNRISARIHPSANWFRLDQSRAPKSASREDILTVLANIDTILIRATPSTDTSTTFLSDITLDTAVDIYTGKPQALSVETCRCPQGYSGTSCESCSSGYYRDWSYSGTNPLGSCRLCPCNRREESCFFDHSSRGVVCRCYPGYGGRYCDETEIITSTRRPGQNEPTPLPPTIDVVITGHNIEIYQIGSSLRLNCSAVSRITKTPVRIDWSKDSDRLPYYAVDDGLGGLTINKLSASDSGRYICKADDGYTVVTESINIVVGETSRDVPPIVALSDPFVQASEGQLIDVRCTATGIPTPEFYLSRTDGQPLNPAHSFDNGVFRIHQARTSDGGHYQCTAVNRAGHASKSFEVQVTAGSVLSVKVEPTYFDGQAGDQVILRCIADRGQNIRWSKEGGALPYQNRDENGVLIIPNAQPSDSGTYICTATSYDGTRGTQFATVNIRSSINTKPTVRIIPDTLTLRQGETTDVRCEAGGVPINSVKWTKYSGDLGGNVRQIGNDLHITNARIEDRGIYTCVVSNGFEIAQGSARIEVTRFESPLLQILPDGGNLTVLSGNTVQLQCRVTQGYPGPTVTWNRANGRPLTPNVEVLAGGNIRIMDITPSEQGEYICTATNEAGTATAVAYITVNVPPSVSVSPDQDTILRPANDNLRLVCYGSGDPQPSVSWVKPNSDSYSRTIEPYQTSPVYIDIPRLSQQDAGVYICVARSSAGLAERRVRVDILPERGDNPAYYPPGGDTGSLPAAVEDFTAVAGARAEIRCSITSADSYIKLSSIKWKRVGSDYLPYNAYSTNGVLYIDNVQPESAGEYECIAYDDHPNKNTLYKIRSRLRVISPPRITLNPVRQTVKQGDNAYIQCTASGDEPIEIFWQSVNRTLPASVYTNGGDIRFSNIHREDAGKYRCVARNHAGEADSVAEVVVTYGPTVHHPPVEDHRVTASAGNNATLKCRPNIDSEPSQVGWNSQVRWTKGNGPLPDSARVYGPDLVLPYLTKEDEGYYYCEINTPAGNRSDYVYLEVSEGPKAPCPPNWWRCDNGNCVSPRAICNDKDDCFDGSDERSCARTSRGPSVKSLPTRPSLHITPETNEYSVGSTIDVNCQSNERGVIPAWSKLGGGLAENVQNRAGRLTIYDARQDNSGTYRCEATGQQESYYKDLTIVVEAPDEPVRDEVPLQVQRAKRGSSVILECNTDLEEPVTYFWSKQGGSLPFYIEEYSKAIQLNMVGAIDAGTYICSATSQRRTLDIPIVLVVTGIIPYFTQAPNSYITLPTLADAYLQFSFEISFKPENDYGLILYNGNREDDKDGDFIALALDNGLPEFMYNLGPGTPTTTVRGNESVADRQWHTIKVVRNKKRVIMFVDGKGPFIGENEGKYFGLDLSEPLFLGGVPNYDNISPEVVIDTGLVGCISKFKIGYTYQDILHDSLNSTGITNCETCTEDKCHNRGTCQEALTTEGYTCICPAKFSGPTCNKRKGEACSPYACGVGKCIDTEYSFTCQCPWGRSGRQCEKTIQVYEPAFKDNAFIAYPPPKPLKRTKIEMKIKPRSVEDSVLLYAAETNEGHGDFVSLTIKDRHLEFRFDNGKGPVVIRSNEELVPNKWSVISAIRSSQDGRIIVNGRPSPSIRFSTFLKTLTLLTPLYVGGFDEHTIRLNQGVKVNQGFNGCIVDVNISGLDETMMTNITDSSNVEACSAEDDIDNHIETGNFEDNFKPSKTGCSNYPCKNNATCIPLSPYEYKCVCIGAFAGKDCETPVDLCESKPCHNDGICRHSSIGFTCDCPLGYGGPTCDQRVELRSDAHFDGNGWLEFSKSLLPHRNDYEAEVIALELSTNKSDGLIFWHGQEPSEDGQGRDYISLALSNGYLEFSYDLGSGPALLRNAQIKVNDGDRHTVILKRQGREGSIDVDQTYVEEGESEGEASSLDCKGNIYLGGTPNINKMTGSRFTSGFDGCIHGFELQQSKTLDLNMKAINGLNVKPCSSFSDIDNNIWAEDLIN